MGTRFAEYLAGVNFTKPRRPYLPNRLATLLETPEPQQFVNLLSTHVHRPVLWQRSVDLVLDKWPQALLVEVGPKTVLFNLLDRKWHRDVQKFHVDTTEKTAEHLQALIATLQQRAAA